MQFNQRQQWIIIAAALVFALLFGVQQSRVLLIGPINPSTGLGMAAISLAFACAQWMWGIGRWRMKSVLSLLYAARAAGSGRTYFRHTHALPFCFQARHPHG